MSPELFYQWSEEVRSHFPNLNKWQGIGLALISYGIIKSRHAQASIIAEELPEFGKASTVERRIQRWLANIRICPMVTSLNLSKWIFENYADNFIFLLVDETKIGERIACMMISLAIKNRSLPLIWRCYKANSSEDYPAEGQVKMISNMLKELKKVIPAGKSVIVEADRGIGNSSNLMREVEQEGFSFLFRINSAAIFTSKDGVSTPLKKFACRGKHWTESGSIFTAKRNVSCSAHILWDEDCDEPWLLATNMEGLSGEEYKIRVWQEESFRDLKSAGWQWHSSLLRNATIAERLLLAMALAYAWTLSLGLHFEKMDEITRKAVDYLRKHPKYSCFRKGLRFFKRYLYLDPSKIPISFEVLCLSKPPT